MRRFFLIAGILLVWSGTGYCGGYTQQQTVTMPVEDYRAILERLETLQKRVDALEKESPSAKPSKAALPDKLAKDVEQIYDTLDEVETKTLQDKINLGAELRTRVDNFKVKNHLFFSSGSLSPKTDSNDNNWSNRFRLNLDAEIAKNLLFTGRLTAFKNWADSDSSSMRVDANYAHLPDDSDIRLDRAYVDWIPTGLPFPLAITFGRHPSSEGPPFEYRENRLRQSTYPALLFDGEADGIVATFGLERYIGWKDSGLRLAYGKGYQDDDDIDSYLDEADGTGLHDTNFYAAFFETEIPRLKNSLLVLSYIRGDDLTADLSSLGVSGQQANVGDMDLFGIHAQASDIGGSGFDVFISTGLNKSHPNGQTVDFGAIPMGLLSQDGTTSHTGWAVYAGLRYTVPYAQLNNPKIGFEYNHGSEYWFAFNQGSSELYNKLGVRGDVYDFYYIQPFNKYLFMRAGFTYVDYDYHLSGFHIGDLGAALPGMGYDSSDEELRNYYLLLDCRF